MTMSKSEHARKRVEYYTGKLLYFTKMQQDWKSKYFDAVKEEAEMLTGKMKGQIEIEGSTTND